MDKKQAVSTVLIFALTLFIGYIAGNTMTGYEEPMYEESVNHTVNSDTSTIEVNFDNNSFNLLYEDSRAARAYLDFDKDGSSDREINLTNKGEKRFTEEVAVFRGKAYRLQFRYQDNRNKTEDGYVELYRIRQIQ